MSASETSTRTNGLLNRYVPMAAWIRQYQWSRWLRIDVIAGISVAALLIPESLGYAKVAGLPPEVGLYAAPLALLGYVIFGRSTVLVLATSSSTAAISASIVAGIVSGQGADPVTISAALALFTGVIFVMAGLLRLGWVANFMSKTVIEGFIIGLSISIIVGQLDDLFGIEVEGENAVAKLWGVLTEIGSWEQSAMIVGIASLLLLFGLERFIPKLPAALTVVVLSVLYVQIFDPVTLEIVGDIPQGLPAIGLPAFSTAEVGGLIAGGLAVALIGFSEGYGGAVTYARKYGDRLDSSQEFIAYGASNIGASLTSGMVVGGSLSKSAANDAAGAKSQMSNVVNALLVVLTLLFLAPFFESLPEATLAAVVIHALIHSADPRKLAPVWRLARIEFWIAVGVLVTVLVVETLPAIVIGVVISLGIVIFRVSFPRSSELGRDPETGRLKNREAHEEAKPVPGIVVHRFEAPLFYANAEAFADSARDLVDAADPQASVLVVDCEMMFGVDYTGIEALDGLIEDMEIRDVEIRLARVHHDVRERLRSSGTLEIIGEGHLFDRVDDAVTNGT